MLATYYAQYYAHKYCNYATVHIPSYYFNDNITIVRDQDRYGLILPYYAMLQYSHFGHIMLNIIATRKKTCS